LFVISLKFVVLSSKVVPTAKSLGRLKEHIRLWVVLAVQQISLGVRRPYFQFDSKNSGLEDPEGDTQTADGIIGRKK
jgi:hypothetical protein